MPAAGFVSTDAGQLFSYQHVYNPAGAQRRSQDDSSGMGLGNPADGYRFPPMLVGAKRLQGGRCGFWGDDGYQFALVGHIQRVQSQQFAGAADGVAHRQI
jgi:hypothetical protein